MKKMTPLMSAITFMLAASSCSAPKSKIDGAALLEERWGVQGGGTANLALNLHGKGTDAAAIEARLDGTCR